MKPRPRSLSRGHNPRRRQRTPRKARPWCGSPDLLRHLLSWRSLLGSKPYIVASWRRCPKCRLEASGSGWLRRLKRASGCGHRAKGRLLLVQGRLAESVSSAIHCHVWLLRRLKRLLLTLERRRLLLHRRSLDRRAERRGLGRPRGGREALQWLLRLALLLGRRRIHHASGRTRRSREGRPRRLHFLILLSEPLASPCIVLESAPSSSSKNKMISDK